jgi:signal peptidase I
MKRRKEKSVFREYAESIIFAIVLAFIMRQFVVQAFKIPSGSMEQTLLIGDHILVNKFLYRFTLPKRFDIIVFKYPWEEDRDFIKRVIALPGDRVQVRNRQIYVNAQPLQEPYARYTPARIREGDFGPVVVPKKGDTVEIRSDNQLYLNGKPIPIPLGRYYPRDHGSAMTGFEVFYGALFPPGTTLQKPTGPVKVKHDYYFTLGDNRDNSKDSRSWGFVESTRIKGEAFFIYWSWNRNGSLARHVRWDRLGKLLQLAPAGSFAVSR